MNTEIRQRDLTPEEIKTGNRIIALYMGYTIETLSTEPVTETGFLITPEGQKITITDLDYHFNWNR